MFAEQFPSVVHSVAPSLQSDDLGMVEEAIEDSPGCRGISQHLAPVFQGAVGGHDNRALLVSAYHNFEQVFRRRGRQPLHPQVLQHEQIHLAKVIHQVLAGAGGFSLSHVLDEVKGGAIEGGVTCMDGGHGEGDGALFSG